MGSFKSISLLDLKEIKRAEKLSDAKKHKERFTQGTEMDVHSVLELWRENDCSFESCGSLSSSSGDASLSK